MINGDAMKRINKNQFFVAVVLLIVFLVPLFQQFDNFVFHTYETRVFQKEMYTAKTENVNVDYYSFIENEAGFYLGEAQIEILNPEFIHEGDSLVVYSKVGDERILHQVESTDLTHYTIDGITEDNLEYAKGFTLEFENQTTNQVLEVPLVETDFNIYSGQNEEFTVQEMYVYKNRIQLGTLNCASLDQWKEDYDQARIEYRYRKVESDQNDPYSTFYVKSGTMDELFNVNTLEFEDIQMPEGLTLQDLDLSVVIILEGEDDLAFSIQLHPVSEVEE